MYIIGMVLLIVSTMFILSGIFFVAILNIRGVHYVNVMIILNLIITVIITMGRLVFLHMARKKVFKMYKNKVNLKEIKNWISNNITDNGWELKSHDTINIISFSFLILAISMGLFQYAGIQIEPGWLNITIVILLSILLALIYVFVIHLILRQMQINFINTFRRSSATVCQRVSQSWGKKLFPSILRSLKKINKLKADKNVDELINRLSDKKDRIIREAATLALGDIGDKRSVMPLIEALKDEVNNVQIGAVKSLGKIRDEQALDPLVKILKNKSVDISIRIAAADTIAKLGKSGLEHLKVEMGGSNTDVRIFVIKAFTKIGGEEVIEVLVKTLEDKNYNIRKKTSLALDQLNFFPQNPIDQINYYIAKEDFDRCVKIGESAVRPLIKRLNDKNEAIRRSSAEALGKIKDKRAIEPLTNALEDDQEMVREEAFESLHAIDESSVRNVANSNIQWLQDIESWRDSKKKEQINVNNSNDLKKTSDLAFDESTRDEGIQKLKNIIDKYPDCSNPYCLLSQGLEMQKKFNEAEKVLLGAYSKVLLKSDVADSLGSLYFFNLKNLNKSIEWYAKSIIGQRPENPTNWSSYLYLSGIYDSYGFENEASLLKKIADKVRGHPVLLSSEWEQNFSATKSKLPWQLMELILEGIWKVISRNIKVLIELDKKEKEEARKNLKIVHRPDLKCSLCGNCDVCLEYLKSTHVQCCECDAIFCKDCQEEYGYRCPQCGANESMNDLYE